MKRSNLFQQAKQAVTRSDSSLEKTEFHLSKWTLLKQVTLARLLQKVCMSRLASTLGHETWLDDIYQAVLRMRDGAFIDVGTNVGHTLVKIASFDRQRQYIGFEPNISACFFVEQFIQTKKLTNHIILPVALSNQHGIGSWQTLGTGFGATISPVASVIPGFRPESFYTSSKHIYIAPGDEILQQLSVSAIALIKIDVEGSELEVLEGLTSSLETYQPLAVFEVLNNALIIGELDQDTISFREDRIRRLEKILHDRGYHIYRICADRELKKLEKIIPSDALDLSMTDYLYTFAF